MNAQTSRFRQLEVKSDLSNHHALSGHASLLPYDHASQGERAKRISASGFNNDSLIYL